MELLCHNLIIVCAVVTNESISLCRTLDLFLQQLSNAGMFSESLTSVLGSLCIYK